MNYINLEYDNHKKIHYSENSLYIYKKDLDKFLEHKQNMKTLKFAKKVMQGQEIKSNNNIEGIKDDIESIETIIKHNTNITSKEKTRIINLYNGYQYILKNKEINKDSLKKLYDILSKDILTEESINTMGKYYRTNSVYILRNNKLDYSFDEGIKKEKITKYMNQFFEYVNSNQNQKDIDTFIKSQIMHFYFIYVHPYYDVNGRTSRTVSMWYLLNQKKYPYIIFNRAIAFAKEEYEKNIIKSRKAGNITPFLKYMLKEVKKELEKEYVINNIQKNSNISLNRKEEQILEYFLNINGSLSVKNLINLYNVYNPYLEPKKVWEENISPLIEKNILLKNDIYLALNKKDIDIDKKDIKYLNLKKYI